MLNGKETEAEKRKQADGDGNVSGRQKHKKARDGNEDVTAVKEEEVEEFFAILGRIRGAVRHFESANGGGVQLEEASGVQVGPKRENCTVEENLGLDLNEDPKPECDPS
ncbi:protein NIM1-INTERACTING 2-like [Pyrus ussuriensis x Pyrus communis]|uniref:Protein NIM1-INTERACTING 2-like n=1 Tax=Pyrus ussuriensis x Pyrus communis TaxID=2448454 RepID=A0A5N5H8L7_9ROSA|nr:protein NIM1-INTERACTING 2-like [Pyrus ussuriensis x Pyrus communis]